MVPALAPPRITMRIDHSKSAHSFAVHVVGKVHRGHRVWATWQLTRRPVVLQRVQIAFHTIARLCIVVVA